MDKRAQGEHSIHPHQDLPTKDVHGGEEYPLLVEHGRMSITEGAGSRFGMCGPTSGQEEGPA